jgi:hypothetical protein
MDEIIKKTIKSLKRRNFKALYAENKEEACNMLLDLVPPDMSVGTGDSSSVRQSGILKQLEARGNRVINPFDPEKEIDNPEDYSVYVFKSSIEAGLCDLFITGTNVLTEDGRLLNIDGVGNRVAGIIWGHQKVFIILGRNKIVKTLDEAFERMRKVIAPEHVSRREVSSAPCGSAGECVDCIGSDRICNITTIMEGCPPFTEITVVIVNEDLGLGWDISWPEERKNNISENHNRHMWSIPHEAITALTREELWERVKEKT